MVIEAIFRFHWFTLTDIVYWLRYLSAPSTISQTVGDVREHMTGLHSEREHIRISVILNDTARIVIVPDTYELNWDWLQQLLHCGPIRKVQLVLNFFQN